MILLHYMVNRQVELSLQTYYYIAILCTKTMTSIEGGEFFTINNIRSTLRMKDVFNCVHVSRIE